MFIATIISYLCKRENYKLSFRAETTYNAPQEGVLPSHAERISQEFTLKKSPTDDKEESFPDSGFDIPRFAEIEAMVKM